MKNSVRVVAACATFGLAFGAQPAFASFARIGQERLIISYSPPAETGAQPLPDPNEVNTITVSQVGSDLVVNDVTAPLGAGYKCLAVDPHTASCTGYGTQRMFIGTGLGNDTITSTTNLPTQIAPGGGDDKVFAGDGDDVIEGEGGVDEIHAGGGNDTIDVQGTGTDYVYCGPGTDTAIVDKFDFVDPDCENVQRETTPGAPTAPVPAPAPAPGTSAPPAAAPSPSTPTGPAGANALTSPRLRVISARVLRRTLRMRGALVPQSAGAVRVTITARVRGRTVRVTRTATVNRSAGTYTFVMRLGPRVAQARRLALAVRYAGDQHHVAQTLRRTVAVH